MKFLDKQDVVSLLRNRTFNNFSIIKEDKTDIGLYKEYYDVVIRDKDTKDFYHISYTTFDDFIIAINNADTRDLYTVRLRELKTINELRGGNINGRNE